LQLVLAKHFVKNWLVGKFANEQIMKAIFQEVESLVY